MDVNDAAKTAIAKINVSKMHMRIMQKNTKSYRTWAGECHTYVSLVQHSQPDTGQVAFYQASRGLRYM